MLCNAVQRPKNNPNPSWGSENKVYCVEILRFCCIANVIWALCLQHLAILSRSKLFGQELGLKSQFADSPTDRNLKNAFKSFGAIRIKTSFVENYKDCTICAILRENTLFCLAATEAKTRCAMPNAIQCPKIMQIPLGDQKVIFIAQKFAFLSVGWKFH